MNGGSVSGLVGANRYEGKIGTANITINGGEVSAVIANQGAGGGGGGSSFASASAGRWIMTGQGWWYRYGNAGYPANAWAYLDGAAIGMAWYHFDAAGYMQTGWFTDTDGHRYYLHTISDGNRGTMYTGWHQIDGKWYYFTETRTNVNPAGSLLINTTTPDGFAVDETGARR